MSGVRGFSDPNVLRSTASGKSRPVWKQFGYQPGVGVDPTGYMEPFHLVQFPPTEDGATTNDISHEWATTAPAWNGGAMDNFVGAHLAADGVKNFATTMGYFTRGDLPFYYALADAFTICDAYHCSVLGPTDPNRVMALSGTIDPAGTGGGPVLVTQTTGRLQQYGTFTWTTMPEQLLDAGVTWKVYNDPTGLALFNPLPYFKAYNDPTTTRGQQLQQQALTPTFPADFVADVAAGTLPQVSWIHGPAVQCEHPATAPQWGENLVQTVLDTLTSNPEVWATTLFILHYDENGGFFDHVPPPVATGGHRRRVPDGEPACRRPPAASSARSASASGCRASSCRPSPAAATWPPTCSTTPRRCGFSRRSSASRCPTSRLATQRDGRPDQALALGQPANDDDPALPDAPLVEPLVDEQIIVNALPGTFDEGIAYPPPTSNVMPTQETNRRDRSPARPRSAPPPASSPAGDRCGRRPVASATRARLRGDRGPPVPPSRLTSRGPADRTRRAHRPASHRPVGGRVR